MSIASWPLPLQFDPARLQADLARIAPEEWIPHFNTNYYEGDWSGISLRAARGSHLQLYQDPTAHGVFEDTEFLERCPYFREVLSAFNCELESVRLLRLRAGSSIREHCDYKLGLEDGSLRIHVPIQTNADVHFYIEDQLVTMGVGETWYLNVNRPHRVENASVYDRVHLVIDGIVNDWVRGMFPAEAFTADPPQAPQLARPLERIPPQHPELPPDLPANPITAAIIAFLREIGLQVCSAQLSNETFLPGIAIEHGGLLVDETRLLYPGDLLHEAGHLAVAEPQRRVQMHQNAGADPAEEMMAIAWSYAAARHLHLDPLVVFHEIGYRGGGSHIAEQFNTGQYIGLPMLQWVGMALDAKQASIRDLPAYPAMIAWLRPVAMQVETPA